MFCTNCGNRLYESEMFCSKCGKDLKSFNDLTRCPKCDGARNEGEFCTQCGFKYQYSQKVTRQTSISKPKKNTIFILSLVTSIVVASGIVFFAIYYS